MRSLPLLLLARLTACVSTSETSSSAHPGSADAVLARPSGATDALTIAGPPGELRLSFVENGARCTLNLNASDPRRGDLRSEAKKTRRVLELDLPVDRIPESAKGAASETTVGAPGVLAGDAMVRVELGRPDEGVDGWYAVGGGTVRVGPLAKDGEVVLEVVDVPMKALSGNLDKEPRQLRATIHARYEGFRTLGAPSGACPNDLPGR